MATLRVIVFDDYDDHRKEILDVLTKGFGRKGKVFPFNQGPKPDKDESYEERLCRDLLDESNSPDLIVADRDLSSYKQYPGLSESTVRIAAEKLGIPECGYARETKNKEEAFLDESLYGEACIRLILPPKPKREEFAKEILSIAEGFSTIHSWLYKNKSTVRKAGLNANMADFLAALLGKPNYSDKIGLYAFGDKNRLVTWVKILKEKDQDAQLKKLACFYGYWLWDSILRFPGIVVNEIAAGSYLNISPSAFKRPEVRKIFDKAIYKGPFAEAVGGRWWRGALDDLIAESGCPDGNSLVRERLKKVVATSQCCDNPSKPAGYYCVFSGKPVSLENSTGGLNWFPRGADLARISKNRSQEDMPWL